MNNATLYIPELLDLMQKMKNDNMTLVRISFNGEMVDETEYFPAFLYFEGLGPDGKRKDYESMDVLDPPELQLLRELSEKRAE